MTLPSSLTTVTRFSKTLAMILFMILPFAGFYIGSQYQKSVDSSLFSSSQKTFTNYPIYPTPPKGASPTTILLDTLVVITNSASTNSLGYTLTVNNDGGGLLQYQKFGNQTIQDKNFPANNWSISNLRNDLQAVGDVSKINRGECMKSISFGTSTLITYQGKTSQDIQCVSQNDPQINKDLATEVINIVNKVPFVSKYQTAHPTP